MKPFNAPSVIVAARAWRAQVVAVFRSHTFLLLLLAGQYALVQALTGIQYGDAPRNLHWGILTTENPAFLLGAPDTYERIKGFPPDPPSLAPLALHRFPQAGLHRWWGPMAPALFGLVWATTGSYTALQLVVPLAGAGVVLLTYQMGRLWLARREALIGAAFLACFPLFRDYATVSYTEALSALALTAALLAHCRGRTGITVLLGGITALMKLDLLLLYFGAITVAAGYVALDRRRSLRAPVPAGGPAEQPRPVLHHIAALAGPAIIAAPWVWYHYLDRGMGAPASGMSLAQFGLVAPQMLELLFYVPWYGATLTLAIIGVTATAGLRSGAFPPLARAMLLAWFGLGLVVVLVYAATPGAGNSPRIIIPALPPLALMVAAGLARLATAWRRRIGFYLVVLFTLINLVTIGYYAIEGARLRSYAPVWHVLRELPRGYVLTEAYWPAILYARQPATWFEFDEAFQRNIMYDADHFARYFEQHPIAYVVLPADDGVLASADVRAYLEQRTARRDAGNYVVYLRRP